MISLSYCDFYAFLLVLLEVIKEYEFWVTIKGVTSELTSRYLRMRIGRS